MTAVGLAALLSPLVRSIDRNDDHETAHLIVGSALATSMLARALARGAATRAIDTLVVVLGLGFGALPWLVPDTPGLGAAGDYHDLVHVVGAALVVAAFAGSPAPSKTPGL